MDFEAFSDAFGRCLACGEPCTTGGCQNPSCWRCQRRFTPASQLFNLVEYSDGSYILEPAMPEKIAVIVPAQRTTGEIQADTMARDLAEKLERWAKALRDRQGYVIRTSMPETASPQQTTFVTEVRIGDEFIEVVELRPV